MTITFLGTGTSQGVPVIACSCDVCLSKDPKDKRLRSSILVEIEGWTYVIDTGPDFRYQMLREHVQHLDGVLFTHEHKDHIAGLDDVRAFNQKQKEIIPIYADQRVIAAIKREFYYAFMEPYYPGVPQLKIHEIDQHEFIIGEDTPVVPIEVMHHLLPVKGFRIGDFTYITDMKTISEEEMQKVKGTKILVLNALQQAPHISHLTLEEALAFSKALEPEVTYFTHISHRLGVHQVVSQDLPDNVFLAYDGLRISSSAQNYSS